MTAGAREPARVVRTRPAGGTHAVLSTEGGAVGYRRRPCGGCPWAVANDGLFPAEAFVHSAETAYGNADRMFGCHEAGPESPMTCAGFLLNGSAHNLAARVARIAQDVNPDELTDGGRALHPSYRAMAVANGVDPHDPALGPCRGDDE